MATEAVKEEFITIVPVGDNRPITATRNSAYVTVLTVGAATGASEVIVRRPKGARLGLGLKFEGGSAAAEKVKRLLVQSCAEDSPAANAVAPWGKLIPGDEILAIDGVPVSELTRIDCVRRLKDSDEILKLLVRHLEIENSRTDKENDTVDSNVSPEKPNNIVRPSMLPPPVPPRKLGKKNSFKDKSTLQTVGEQNAVTSKEINNHYSNIKDGVVNGSGMTTMTKLSRKSSFDSHILRQSKEAIGCLRKGSPEEVRRLVRRLSDGKSMPPEAEVYIDLLSSEWERCLLLADAESDDTGSSISTVVDRLGSMASSVENSIPSTPIMQPKTIDIQKVLNCIENIDSNILRDMTNSKFLDNSLELKCDVKTEQSSANKIHSQEQNQNPVEVMEVSKKHQQNDKNNNDTSNQTVQSAISNRETTKLSDTPEKAQPKVEISIEKPKPMPRNTKIERSQSEKKPKPIMIPETPPPPIPEPLLTPTKKNCIETWLQRSEAEMNNNNIEKLEDASVPEVLPRLIDFVPKQLIESTKEPPSLPRPLTAPPPPPPPLTETREDGSGASLDTIGELDESSDAADNGKPTKLEKNIISDRKSFDGSFWEDRTNRSDAEDKSLSNDETPPPMCPRQPPDGVEAPADMKEKTLDLTTQVPSRLQSGWTTSRPRYSYISRSQDARSEASVKDKIAMFSNDHIAPTESFDKYGTQNGKVLPAVKKVSPSYMTYTSNVTSLDRRLTKSQDNLDEAPYTRPRDRPEIYKSVENRTSSFSLNGNKPLQSDTRPLFYGSTTTLPSSKDASYAPNISHTRSVSDDNDNKKVHKSNLEYLIEQRKKAMSKLRGLVIPEVQGPIIDLPEIKVQDPLSTFFLMNSMSDESINTNEINTSNKKTPISNELKWKNNYIPSIPKYSPAFKRKSLQVFTPSSLSKESTPERKLYEKPDLYKNNITKNMLNNKSILDNKINSIDRKVNSALDSKSSTNNYIKLSNKELKDILDNPRDYKNVEIKICTATDIVDSDNDSAMSSTQSSYRSSASSPMHNLEAMESDGSRVSPKSTIHYSVFSTNKIENMNKREVCRSVSSDTNVSLSSSAGSGATSGSQASCSSLESSVPESEKKQLSKSYNIDTINRRNILASAKCRSGRDSNVKSPVVETKFCHESKDKSPSPKSKSSDRLSTLTTVSVAINKGDTRRRNKIIAESDSDSDNEINVRQRKSEFKNTRLKRNSSSGNKNKQNDDKSEMKKSVDELSKNTFSKTIQEMKRTVHENKITVYDNSSTKIVKSNLVEKKEIKKVENKAITKEEPIPTIYASLKNDHIANDKPSIITSSVCSNKIDDISLNETNVSTQIIRLNKGAASGFGVILAGGVDCEAKDVTVHRVLADSVAAKAGLKRGVKICSINGRTMMGLTHAESVTILKEQRSEVVIEIEQDELKKEENHGFEKAEESKDRVDTTKTEMNDGGKDEGCVVTVILEKVGGGAGLGFGLDGGRDSPQGDRPLTIKKLFAGGAAAQSGCVLVGAELLSAGGQSMEGYTRTQAWAALKALPPGPVSLVLRNPK